MALNLEAYPADSKKLTGYAPYRRVGRGEFRIIYRYDSTYDTVTIAMVGKRNDNDVCWRLSRQ